MAMNMICSNFARTMSEIDHLSSPKQFFISYKTGTPKIGEAQDAIIGMAEFTRSDTRLDKYHAMQMFNQVQIYHDFSKYNSDKIFTGREIVSILLKETGNLINYVGKPSIYAESQVAYRKYDPMDIKIEIDRGELKSGVLDKNSIGEGARGGVFHIIHNQYGAQAALDAVFNLQQIAMSFLYYRGVSMSIKDILLKNETLHEIHKIEKTLIAESLQITEQLNQGKIIPPIGKTITEYYETLQSNALQIGDSVWPYILPSIDPDDNNLFKVIMSGSRGKMFNFKNISSAVGQIEINGERMKENFGGRTLPYFTKYDSDPASRGYIGNSYISGMNLTEFLFHSQENRYTLINKALSTSITGMFNRMAVKNLESLIIDNQYKCNNDGKIIQLLYGADGADPRFVEEVRLPTMKKDLTDKQFELEFRNKIENFSKEFQNPKVEKLLSEEFEQLKKDREFFRNLFLRLEITSDRPYKDTCTIPANINLIIEDTLYNLELKKLTNIPDRAQLGWDLDPIRTIEKVQKLTESICYCFLNETQEKNKTPIPQYIQNNTSLFRIAIRSYLNTNYLLKKGINNEALDIIILNIKNSYSRSLVNYGKAMGIIAAQSISEPMTQTVLNSHHLSGVSSTKKQGMFRVKEILGARPTDKMKSPTMVLQVRPEFRSDKYKVQEIANHIETLYLKKFVYSYQIFFEKYGRILHPNYKQEIKMIQDFEKYNSHIRPPSDLANWCIRLSLSKSVLIEKQMKVETIYHKIRQTYPFTYLVYNSDNADNIIIRIYVRNTIAKKSQITTNQITELTQNILNTIIRGISGIRAAYVQENSKTIIGPEGNLINQSQYSIYTDGTNMEEILENPYIDPDTVQSDSIIEMFECCGITAARQKIIDELKHQIPGPSYRHYTIYGDEMTYPGYITSIDRYGSEKRNSSIMLRISDASPISVIENAAVNGMRDDLTGISPPIMVGKNPIVGDLYNSFRLDEEFVKSQVKNLKNILEEL